MKYIRITFAILAALSVSASAFGQAGNLGANGNPAWVQLAKLSSSYQKAYGNASSVATSGNVIVVGAPGTYDGGLASVFVRGSGGWHSAR